MRSAVVSIGGLLLFAWASASPAAADVVAADVVAPDAVDQLLFGDAGDDSALPAKEAPAASSASPATPAAAPASAARTAPSAGFDQQATWNARAKSQLAVGGGDHDLAVETDARMIVEHKEPAGPFTAVPEPSAIFLAVAALVYFLLFGRRRRMV
ncbi:MAG: hypothetical protein AB7O59_09900 [Pirellulales bacterium]